MIDGNLVSVYTVIFQCKHSNHSRVNLEHTFIKNDQFSNQAQSKKLGC